MKRSLLAGCCLLVTLGCTRIHHHYRPHQAAGSTLPIEVTVTHKPADIVRGIVHYRTQGYGPYAVMPMERRANQLWAMLPTEHLAPDDTIEYYIDITKNDRMTALASPASPFTVKVLDRTGMALTKLSDRPLASDSNHEVSIILYSREQHVGRPIVSYRIPGVPGDIRASMEADGYGNYRIAIPPDAVRAGTWRYAIEFELDGREFRRPETGYRSFEVVEPYVPEFTEVHTDGY
jgi:hypothetical protein